MIPDEDLNGDVDNWRVIKDKRYIQKGGCRNKEVRLRKNQIGFIKLLLFLKMTSVYQAHT